MFYSLIGLLISIRDSQLCLEAQSVSFTRGLRTQAGPGYVGDDASGAMGRLAAAVMANANTQPNTLGDGHAEGQAKPSQVGAGEGRVVGDVPISAPGITVDDGVGGEYVDSGNSDGVYDMGPGGSGVELLIDSVYDSGPARAVATTAPSGDTVEETEDDKGFVCQLDGKGLRMIFPGQSDAQSKSVYLKLMGLEGGCDCGRVEIYDK